MAIRDIFTVTTRPAGAGRSDSERGAAPRGTERDRPMDVGVGPVAGGGDGGGDGRDGEMKVGAFVTAQSFASFPAVTAIIWTLWKLSYALLPRNWALSLWTPALICLFFGVLLFLIGITDKMKPKELVIASLIALVNTALLLASVLGTDNIANNIFPTTPTPTPSPTP